MNANLPSETSVLLTGSSCYHTLKATASRYKNLSACPSPILNNITTANKEIVQDYKPILNSVTTSKKEIVQSFNMAALYSGNIETDLNLESTAEASGIPFSTDGRHFLDFVLSEIKADLTEEENIELDIEEEDEELDTKPATHIIIHNTEDFTCTKCNKRCSNHKAFKNHMKFHRMYAYVCGECKKQFISKKILARHVKIMHVSNPKYKCEFCDMHFRTVSDLKKHVSSKHEKCRYCVRSFLTENDLKQHINKSHKAITKRILEKLEFKKQCSKKTLKKLKQNEELELAVEELDLEDEEERGIEEVQTNTCNKFKTSKKLARHRITPFYEYVCGECRRHFRSKKHLAIHVKKCHDNPKYKCEFCEAMFSAQSYVKQHVSRSHEFKVKCRFCDSIFKNQYDLKKHHTQLHVPKAKQLKKFECKECHKKYSNKKALKKHVCHSSEKYKSCPHCRKLCKSQSALIKHMNTHSNTVMLGVPYYGTVKQEAQPYGLEQWHNEHANEQNEQVHMDDVLLDNAVENHLRVSLSNAGESCLHVSLHHPVETHAIVPLGNSYSDVKSEVKEEVIIGEENTVYESQQFYTECSEQNVESSIETHADEVKQEGKVDNFVSEQYYDESTEEQNLESHNLITTDPENSYYVTVKQEEEAYIEYITGDAKTQHMETNTDEKLKCKQCGKEFGSRYLLGSHLATHTGSRYRCHVCGKDYSTKHYLEAHIWKLHPNCSSDQSIADFGGSVYASGTPSNSQFDFFNETLAYSCDLCTLRFRTKYLLSTHLKIMHLGILFECDYCHKQYTTPTYLNVHKKIHSEGKSACCPQCNKLFANKKCLSKHIKLTCKSKLPVE